MLGLPRVRTHEALPCEDRVKGIQTSPPTLQDFSTFLFLHDHLNARDGRRAESALTVPERGALSNQIHTLNDPWQYCCSYRMLIGNGDIFFPDMINDIITDL